MDKRLMCLLEFYQEKIIEFSDISYKEITNDKAKEILGRYFHIPSYLQTTTINAMIKYGLLERKNQKLLEIKSSSQE